jgi:hypothetical protein
VCPFGGAALAVRLHDDGHALSRRVRQNLRETLTDVNLAKMARRHAYMW